MEQQWGWIEPMLLGCANLKHSLSTISCLGFPASASAACCQGSSSVWGSCCSSRLVGSIPVCFQIGFQVPEQTQHLMLKRLSWAFSTTFSKFHSESEKGSDKATCYCNELLAACFLYSGLAYTLTPKSFCDSFEPEASSHQKNQWNKIGAKCGSKEVLIEFSKMLWACLYMGFCADLTKVRLHQFN